MDRVIYHCDLNAFYASVELLEHPELRDLPVAVGGDAASRRGIILAKNEAAKKMGVKTAETIWQAKGKCPGLVLLPPHHEKYSHYSKLVNAIYLDYTDLVEPFGIDESWLDLTGSLHLFGGDAKKTADEIRARVKKELGLTVSIGVSFNKVFAKLGSDYKKPDATTVISRENYKDIVWPLPVGELLFVGEVTAQTLGRLGIQTIGDLAACPKERLVTLLGKHGAQLYHYATGEERSPVRPNREQGPPKSVGNGSTFSHDLVGREEIRTGAARLSAQVARRLRRYGLKGTTLQVTIRNPGFQDRSRQRRLDMPTCLSREILAVAMELMGEIWDFDSPVRALTITLSGLLPQEDAGEQVSIFDPQRGEQMRRQENLERIMDSLQGKYGRDIIGFSMKKKKAEEPREETRKSAQNPKDR